MNPILTVADPLADKAVTIVVTLVAGGSTRDERLALVSVGAAEQPPVSRSGRFDALLDLINAAWTAYGVQAQLTAAVSSDELDEELVAEEEVAASVAATHLPQTAVPPPPPRPQVHNLSLF
ncbi:MAG: hypothetical protein IPM39_09465 [Chloroflexi bacterium]|nr:hypothetical protein [Chloroflexota bacterium]